MGEELLWTVPEQVWILSLELLDVHLNLWRRSRQVVQSWSVWVGGSLVCSALSLTDCAMTAASAALCLAGDSLLIVSAGQAFRKVLMLPAERLVGFCWLFWLSSCRQAGSRTPLHYSSHNLALNLLPHTCSLRYTGQNAWLNKAERPWDASSSQSTAGREGVEWVLATTRNSHELFWVEWGTQEENELPLHRLVPRMCVEMLQRLLAS